jgi:hypothetical protein
VLTELGRGRLGAGDSGCVHVSPPNQGRGLPESRAGASPVRGTDMADFGGKWLANDPLVREVERTPGV